MKLSKVKKFLFGFSIIPVLALVSYMMKQTVPMQHQQTAALIVILFLGSILLGEIISSFGD